MPTFVDMLNNNNFLIYSNSLDRWIVQQEYEALTKLYKAWNADRSIQEFLIQNVNDTSYNELFVGKFFLNEDEDAQPVHYMPSDFKDVGDTLERSKRELHNWSKKKDVAEGFSKIQYAKQSQTAYSHGFIAKCTEVVPSTQIVCDCRKLIVYIMGQLKYPEVIKLAEKNNAMLVKDISYGNEMMMDEYEVLTTGNYDTAKIIATWRRINENGKIHVDAKGAW